MGAVALLRRVRRRPATRDEKNLTGSSACAATQNSTAQRSACLAHPMNSRLLIDAFVRQTMVLIAQVATMAGVRTPLAHVANQVFLDLTQALEQQGLGRKVV